MENGPQHLVGLLSGSELAEVGFKLPGETHTAICKALNRAPDDPAMLMFLDMLKEELGIYAVLEQQRQQRASLKQQCKALESLAITTGQLINGLASLDALNYRTLLQGLRSAKGIHGVVLQEPTPGDSLPNVAHPDPLGDLHGDLQVLFELIEGSQTLYKFRMKRGAPAKKSRKDLIDFIVRAYKACFDSWPVSTVSKRNGGFEAALRLSLESVNIVISDLESEIKESLNRVRGK